MTHAKIFTPLLFMILFLALIFGLSMTARAQDFYGEGNVLIAVDMAPYAENENVDYPEGTMGTLVWGPDAPTGDSTRPAFAGFSYEAPPVAAPVAAPKYKLETAYSVGQKMFLPYIRSDDPDYYGWYWFTADGLPTEIFKSNGEPNFLIHKDNIITENGETWFAMYCEITVDGEIYPCVDFVELECVAVNEHTTLWQYTGKAYSERTGFDPEDYGSAVNLTNEETASFTEICENAYTVEGALFGDPRFEDTLGDKDGRAAFVFIGYVDDTGAYYSPTYTNNCGFDCLVMKSDMMPRDALLTDTETWGPFLSNLAHELNHYIVNGCTGHMGSDPSLSEAFAQRGADAAVTAFPTYEQRAYQINCICSRLRVIPGLLYDTYPLNIDMPYALGSPLLRYIERVSGGGDRLWADYLAAQTPDGGFPSEALDSFLRNTTGEGLDAWIAQFLAALVTDEDEGLYCFGDEDVRAAMRLDRNVFFRDAGDYGKKLGVIDETVAADEFVLQVIPISAVQGGGTTYAWRNDEGGKIAITGAEDRWYFYAVTMDLPAPDAVIEISTAEELAMIGHDPAYPLSSSYALTADIDLGGSEKPWTPIGIENDYVHFTGEFDGGGHTVSGLFINSDQMFQGLFGRIDGGADIRNLTVYGSVTGGERIGGIVGESFGGTVENCVSFVTVTGQEDCGGIVGYAKTSTVSGCKGFGTVTGQKFCGGVVGYSYSGAVTDCVYFAAVTGEKGVGGIAGFSEYSAISECWNNGSVTGERNVGGIVGSMSGDYSLRDCYNTGTVTGSSLVGAIAGDGFNGIVTVENSYSYQPDLPAVGERFEGTVTASYVRSDTEHGEGYLTTAAFGNTASFEGWDFENVWSLDNGLRPILRNNPETIYTDDDDGEPVIPAKEEKNAAEMFDDVSEDDLYYEAVNWAVNEGLMNGVGEDTFDPEGTGTRAMVVTMLWRMAGEPEAGKAGFNDIAADSWYNMAVNWAFETGAVLGTSEDTFSPNKPITREQLAVILYRYAQSQGLGFTGDWAFRLDYSDVGDISDYAYEAMCWMTMHGVINGMGDGTVAPQSEATRAQIAAMFMRFSEEML